MTAYKNWSAHVPTIATTVWGDYLSNPTGQALSSGHTHVTSPAHPWAGALGEYVNQIDMNNAGAVYLQNQRYFNDSPASPPDNTKRWAVRVSFLHRRNSTSLSSSRVIVEGTTGLSGPRDFILKEKTDRQLELYVDSTLVATTTSALTADTWYQLEIWEVFNNPDGSARSTRQWVVRAISSSSATDWNSGNLTIQTLIDVDVSSSAVWSLSTTSIRMGETTANGAGALHFSANLAVGWEDADDPFGIIRVDQMVPNATGATNDWTTITAGGVDVDESGTAVPDNATTLDSTSILAASSPDTVTYDLTSPAYITTGDQPISARLAVNTLMPVPGKGEVHQMFPVMSDGSTLDVGTVTLGANNTWQNLITVWKDMPGAAANAGFTVANLTDLEAGVRGTTTAVGAVQFDVSTITVWVGYMKAGEKTSGLPRTCLTPALLRQRRNRALKAFPPMEMGVTFDHYQGVFAQPAVVVSARRRFISFT